MMASIRIRMTVVFEYEADPVDYDTNDPVAMIAIDKKNLDEGTVGLDDLMESSVVQSVAFEVIHG